MAKLIRTPGIEIASAPQSKRCGQIPGSSVEQDENELSANRSNPREDRIAAKSPSVCEEEPEPCAKKGSAILRKTRTASSVVALKIPEVCRLTGFGRTTIYAAIKSGDLIARRYRRRTFVLEEDLLAFLRSQPLVLPSH